ncbi:MAG: ATP-binding protein [bacterium]|nr:ATP-binding protein [bacterium]
MRSNPFSPSFGTSPPVLAGRDHILEDVDGALSAGPSHPDYTMFLIGNRGAGKTALLNALEERSRERNWLTIAANASNPGLLNRIEAEALVLFQERGGRFRRTAGRIGERLDRVWVLGFRPSPLPKGLRNVLTALGDALGERGLGVLITIDELQSGERHELRRFASVLQQVTRREGRPIAFVGAALPRIEDTLLADDAVTFLQRAARREINRLDETATRTAIAQPIRDWNGSIDSQGLEVAIRATSGYPFMIQLVGYHSWEATADPRAGITLADVTTGVSRAQSQIGNLVLAPAWKDLSPMDRRFLEAMSLDESESTLADIAARLQRDLKYASVYRSRLIKSDMIAATGIGRVDFVHHATRYWIRQRGAAAPRPGE